MVFFEFDFKIGKAILPRYADNGFDLLKKMCLENIKLRYDKPTDEILARLVNLLAASPARKAGL